MGSNSDSSLKFNLETSFIRHKIDFKEILPCKIAKTKNTITLVRKLKIEKFKIF